MGRRHLTITAVAAGIGTALTLAVAPYATSGSSSASHFHASASSSTAFAPAGSVRPDGTPYAVGGAGCLLVGAALVVARRRTQA
ncbi:hypothetical protein DN069_18370 [Streptacidiphilus pinicola]|uniref:Uncharacterized protein n=1 Tax=Streptacidiphilus pinicola TaxID=2219663 RepID=A0A2X0II21_9ACTN|nr:hypothetical protein [Streptacidiphilus pinicola]RAG84217.1 hypothetical protein DN069_18370 [Streptacidiphilus pinicola]